MLYHRSKINILFNNIDMFQNNPKEFVRYLVRAVVEVLMCRRDYKYINLNEMEMVRFISDVERIFIEIYEDYLKRTGSVNDLANIIEYVGSGHSSLAFRIGDNVIKIGNAPFGSLPSLIDSNDFVPVYFKKVYTIGINVHFKVEVNPYVNKVSLNDEELYNVYASIRDQGFIWNDPKSDNIGSIINTEGCMIDGEMRKPTKEYVPGQLVVFDLEDMAFVGEETPEVILTGFSYHSYNPNVYTFETRWIKEREEQLIRKRVIDEKN